MLSLVLTAGLLLGTINPNTGSLYEGLSITELSAERVRLLDSMPSLGAGIALTAVGGGLLVTGLVILSVTFDVVEVVVGLVLLES